MTPRYEEEAKNWMAVAETILSEQAVTRGERANAAALLAVANAVLAAKQWFPLPA